MKARLIRYMQIGMAVVSLAGLCWAAYAAILYLKTAPRFDVRKLSVTGLKRVHESEVLTQAGFDAGTNVFGVQLSEIRERVEELDWVRHAMVERILPDQIIIKVVEREPIGLGRIRGEIYQFDLDARILSVDAAGGSSFPILDGLRANDPKGNLKKVQAYRKVLDDLGQTSLSEVHINEAGELSVVGASDPLVVDLGTTDFRSRWIKYLQLKNQIHQQYPQAVRVDLRFKNQVIVRMKDDETGENIVWGAEKKTL
ncbi:MAG TPA: FtsQ-type POTRA domain-containing protein [Terriglobia bacterium]|nr:FtsQ-type POTRA domain-containing protein [Terriglobia bacterium]